jgi:phenylacetate-CoA ligase
LRKLFKEAYENVLYYRELMDRLKLKPSDMRTICDLPKLPILKKEDIRNNLDKFISKKANKRDLVHRHTSGTTGKSLHFYTNQETETLQWAIWWRHRNRFGMTNESWHVNFRGQLLTPAEQKKPPFWRWVAPMKQVVINMQHLNPSKICSIIDFLNQNYFEFYTAYPSFLHILCATASENGLRLTNPPRVIFMGAENTLDFQRRCIEEFTGALISDQYGFAEGCANASQCEKGLYHEDFELGVIECVDPESLSMGRYRGKIVATGLTCHEFPFIRYEVGDIGIWEDPTVKRPCGRHSKLMLGIEGREQDYVLTREGCRLKTIGYIFEDAQNCLETQIVQEELGKIKVFIVKRAAYSSKDEKYVTSQKPRVSNSCT